MMIYIFIKLFKSFGFELNTGNIEEFLRALESELQEDYQTNITHIKKLIEYFSALQKQEEEQKLLNDKKDLEELNS